MTREHTSLSRAGEWKEVLALLPYGIGISLMAWQSEHVTDNPFVFIPFVLAITFACAIPEKQLDDPPVRRRLAQLALVSFWVSVAGLLLTMLVS